MGRDLGHARKPRSLKGAVRLMVDGPGLRRRREEAGLSLRALANAATISPGYVSMIERGQRTNVQPPVAARLAQALGVAIGDLRPVEDR